MTENSDEDTGSEDLGIAIVEDRQPNSFMSNSDNGRNQCKMSKKVDVVAHTTVSYSQYPEDEMHSIQSQMAELEKQERDTHTCPHSESNIWQV